MAPSSHAHSVFNVHRCRFVDYNPASITAIAVPPTPLPRINSHGVQKEPGPKLGPFAVGRGNGNIELYEWSGVGSADTSSQGWVLHKVLYAPTPSKIDTLVFTLRDPSSSTPGKIAQLQDLRLFSAGGGSEILEWDIERGTILRSLSSQGGSIWSFAANPASTVLAVGCEDGGVRLVSVACGAFEHVRRLDRVKTRLLSIAWGPPTPPATRKPSESPQSDDDDEDEDEQWTDSFIVAGCSDSSVRKWDCKTGRVLDRMMVDRNKGERTLVWAVGVFGDGTIVSGDSLGYVKFWDAKTSTQTQSYQPHGADVLCLTVGPEGRSVYTSGVDQKVCQFSRINVDKGDTTVERWIHSTTRRIHVHDVRALATLPSYAPLPSSVRQPLTQGRVLSPILLSGGIDTGLTVTPCALLSSSKDVSVVNPLKTSSSCQFEDAYYAIQAAHVEGLISLAKDARLLMLLRDRGVSLWRLTAIAKSLEDASDFGIRELLDDEINEEKGGWMKVLEMELNVLTNLCAGAISSDGTWLCVSDMYETKLFHLEQHGETIKPKRVKALTSVLLPHVAASSDAEVSTGSTAIAFSPDSTKLILATAISSYILVVDLASVYDDFENISVLRRFEHHRMRNVVLQQPTSSHEPTDDAMDVDKRSVDQDAENDAMQEDEVDYDATLTRISHVVVSPDGQWLATSDVQRRVHVYNLDSIQHHCTLPTFETPIAALAFDPSRPHTLVIVMVGNHFKVFDVEARQFPLWARAVCDAVPKSITNKRDPIQGAAFGPRAADGTERPGLFLWSRDWFCYVELDGTDPRQRSALSKKRRRSMTGNEEQKTMRPTLENGEHVEAQPNGASDVDSDGHEDEAASRPSVETQSRRNYVWFDTVYRSMLYMGFLGDGDLVVVERPYSDVVATFPPAYFKPRYGAS